MTTLYFEIEREDDLRRTGFSKDGKAQNPQIVLGLLVTGEGYPLAYQIFDGKQYEGTTMIPIIEAFKSRFSLDKLIVVADAGLLSKANISALTERDYEYIIGARIKSLSAAWKKKVLALKPANGVCKELKYEGSTRLLISYSDNGQRRTLPIEYEALSGLRKPLPQDDWIKRT